MLWASRLVANVWRAPRIIAAEDRKALEDVYERLRSQYDDVRRELAQRDAKVSRTALREQLAAFLAEGRQFMQRCGKEDEPVPEAEANEWNTRVINFPAVELRRGAL